MKKILAAAALLVVIAASAALSMGISPLAVLTASSGVGTASDLQHIVLAVAVMPMAVSPALYTVAEVCRILSIRTTTVYTLIAKGELDAVKIGSGTRGGRGTRITAKSVEALLAAAPKAEITGKYLTLKTRRRLAREREQGVAGESRS
jgi:excisionase family DNA binding protein